MISPSNTVWNPADQTEKMVYDYTDTKKTHKHFHPLRIQKVLVNASFAHWQRRGGGRPGWRWGKVVPDTGPGRPGRGLGRSGSCPSAGRTADSGSGTCVAGRRRARRPRTPLVVSLAAPVKPSPHPRRTDGAPSMGDTVYSEGLLGDCVVWHWDLYIRHTTLKKIWRRADYNFQYFRTALDINLSKMWQASRRKHDSFLPRYSVAI